MSGSAQTYTGAWIDWSHGRIRGTTITLSNNDAVLITALIAIIVSAAGGAVWKILSYIAHQIRAHADPQDGFFHQQQNLLRNCETPVGVLTELLTISWTWRRQADRIIIRSLLLGIPAAIALVLSTLAGIFSSRAIGSAGNDTLTTSQSCGYWTSSNDTDVLDETDVEVQLIIINDLNSTIDAASYASACYTSNPDSLRCRIYTTPTLPYTVDSSATCPFPSGWCYFSDTAAYKMDTGKLDSNDHLGINFPPDYRVTIQRITTCAPIHIANYTETVQVVGLNSTNTTITDIYLGLLDTQTMTYAYYNDSANFVDGYTLSLQNFDALAPPNYILDGQWTPIPPLALSDADVTVYFLSANAMQYVGPVDDPWFAAHVAVDSVNSASGLNVTKYSADLPVSSLSCTDQYQICNPSNEKCTALSGIFVIVAEILNNDIGLNDLQTNTTERILGVLLSSGMEHMVEARGSAALQAQKSESFVTQIALPSNQWQIEVTTWFTTALAKLQQQMVDYAAGPPGPLTGNASIIPGEPTMCSNQRVRGGPEFTSFSVLGLTVIVVVSAVLIIISLLLDKISGIIQKRWQHGGYRHKQWILNGKLQLQRLAYEGAGIGKWANLEEQIPLTTGGQKFGMPERRKTTMDTRLWL